MEKGNQTLGLFRRRYHCVARRAAADLLGRLSGNLPSGIAHCLENNLDRDVVDVDVDPTTYGPTQVDEFRDDWLACNIMSKYPDFNLGIDTKAVAIAKFIAAEQTCLETNQRLSLMQIGDFVTPRSPESVLLRARGKIARLLPKFSWELAEQGFAFGPHASTRCKRSMGDAYYKYGAEKPHATSNCAVAGLTAIYREPRWFLHLASFVEQLQWWFSSVPRDDQLSRSSELLTEVRRETLETQVSWFVKIAPGNRVGTVPKNAKTDRMIAVEPDLNMYIQTGIGSIIRRCLRRVSIDLNDQSRNQRLAYLGSRYGTLATLDLSSASDTVSLRLVELLLPEDWFRAICIARSPTGVMPDGSIKHYRKVSSMGNGFTFELESLIFWAISRACTEVFTPDKRLVSVYGDDIVVPVRAAHSVRWMLEYCGFSVNEKKSYSTGVFRESCGKHYFAGVDVTPFYVREGVTSIHRLYWLGNQIRRWARRTYHLDNRVFPTYELVRSLVPEKYRSPSIPDGLGDIAFFGDVDECRPRIRPVKGQFRNVYVCKGVLEETQDTFVPDDLPYLIRELEKLAGRRWVFDPVRKVRVLRESVVPTTTSNRRPRFRVINPEVEQWTWDGPWA